MPSTSGRQHRFMEMVAHDPEAAKRLGVPQSVGRDFVEADRGHTFKNKLAGKGSPKKTLPPKNKLITYSQNG